MSTAHFPAAHRAPGWPSVNGPAPSSAACTAEAFAGEPLAESDTPTDRKAYFGPLVE